MSQETSIEWTHPPGYTGATWNPVTGCTKIASGCKHCYAETIAKRFWKDRKFTDVQTRPERLDAPLRRRKPTCYFVNSMSDLFHDDVPFEFIAAVYGVMAACPQNLFIILTKRPKRMRKFMGWASQSVGEPDYFDRFLQTHGVRRPEALSCFGDRWRGTPNWPLPNVIHGYSASTQADLDAGIGDLLATPSALRCLSLEPLIGPITLPPEALRHFVSNESFGRNSALIQRVSRMPGYSEMPNLIHWVIVGGESGPNARPCDIEWIRRIVAQCKAAGVPPFVKQVGSRPVASVNELEVAAGIYPSDMGPRGRKPEPLSFKDRKGADPAEWPQEIRVREYPEVARA